VAVSSTMGPGVKVEPSSLVVAKGDSLVGNAGGT
jgi:hypothetical protein